jgi:UDPglucose 6-dehydrogenase
MMEKIRTALDGKLEGKTIALLGLSFKPNTDDLRESPAIAILDALLAEGAKVRAYDPVAMDAARATERAGVEYCRGEYEAAEGADALVVATEWNQFRGLDPERLAKLLAGPVVLDLRNVHDPIKIRAAGLRYHGVGR